MAKKESKKESVNKDHVAKAKAKSLPVSTKHCIVISDNIRYKSTGEAKKILEGVSTLKKAIPFRRFNRDMGHKAGIASGRYPQKAANEFIKLIKSVEANAQVKGLDVENLKIVKVISNKASAPMTGGRHRRGTKRTHVEIEVKEFTVKKKEKKTVKKSVPKKTEKKETVKKEIKKEVKVEEKKEVSETKVSDDVQKPGVSDKVKVEAKPEIKQEQKPETDNQKVKEDVKKQESKTEVKEGA